MVSELTEADIPDASLGGRTPEAFKIVELSFGFVVVEPADYLSLKQRVTQYVQRLAGIVTCSDTLRLYAYVVVIV